MFRNETQPLDLGLSQSDLVERVKQIAVLQLQLAQGAAVASRSEVFRESRYVRRSDPRY